MTTTIPPEMKAIPQWVVWRYVKAKGRDKPAKLPYQSRDPKKPAKPNDPSTWSSYAEAVEAVSIPGRGLEGIGFMFGPGDGFTGVDLDNCLDESGKVLPWARPILDRLIGYAEVSPSGRGVKVFTRGSAPGGKGRKVEGLGPDGTGAVEIYDRGRYFTVTGRVFEGRSNIGDGADQLASLHAELFPPEKKPTGKARVAPEPLAQTDANILDKIRRSKDGSKFEALFSGSTEGYASQNQADLALCNILAFWFGGRTDAVDAIDRVFRQSGLCRDKWTDRADYREMTIRKALEGKSTFYEPNYASKSKRTTTKRTTTGGGNDSGQPNGEGAATTTLTDLGRRFQVGDRPGRNGQAHPGRPSVEINTQRHEVLEHTLHALADDPELYRRGPFLVTVVRENLDQYSLTPKSVLRNVAGSPKIIAVSDAMLGTRLTKFADFFQWRKTKSGEDISVPAHPPDWLIKAVATKEHWPQIRRLTSVVECPFLRPDGSIVDTPGYDRATMTLYLPSVHFPAVPESPTREDAMAAWGRLSYYVRQFPFVSEDDRVVYLAGTLNVIARTAIEGPVMGVAVIGNKPATGKGLLVDAMTMPGIGRPAPTTSYPDNKEEAVKVKTAIVLSGKPVVHFDNLDEGSTYGIGVMDSALTSYTIDERILGASKNTGDLEVRTTWFLNGNNINPAKDAYRRWMVANLVTDLESPENRGDLEDKHLRKLILEKRGEIARDVLTILRAHALAGWPNGGWPVQGSFEEWDRVVRGAVWFATDRDCLATQKRAAEESPDRLDKINLLEAWRELPGGKWGEGGVTAAEALDAIETEKDKYPALRNALLQRGRNGKPPTAGRLGMILRGMRNSLIGGLKLKQGSDIKRAALWSVELVDAG